MLHYNSRIGHTHSGGGVPHMFGVRFLLGAPTLWPAPEQNKNGTFIRASEGQRPWLGSRSTLHPKI
jgi:hypothetical protein